MIVLFTLTYILALSLPGLALHRLLDLKLNRFICVVAVSYCVFTLSFIGSNYFNVSANNFLIFLGALFTLSSIYLLSQLRFPIKDCGKTLIPILTISALSFLFQNLVGPFNEVPSDLFAHLERYQLALKNIQSNTLGVPLPLSKIFLQGSGVFYHLIASVNFIAPLSSFDVVNIIDFSNRTIFLLSSYFFTRSIFSESPNRESIAGLATLFIFLHFGISVFSYSRYYTFAPTILNMTLYMFGVLSALHLYTNKVKISSLGYTILFALAVTSAAAVHVQEAMFILVMSVCLATCAAIASAHSYTRFTGVSTMQVRIFLVAALILFAFAYIYSSENLARSPNAHWRLWDFGAGFWPLPQLTVLNLGKEFAQVITLWGALVYLLFLINIKRYKNNLFVMSAMLSPAFTILNPFFVDIFLRHYNSTTLWRLCYLIPIHLVAADLFLYYCQKIKATQDFKRVLFIIPVALLTLLLTPYKNTWSNWHYSRLPSLNKPDQNLSATDYIDLITFLDTIKEPITVITDPMTGYMISGMTRHSSPRRKFFRNHKFIHFSFVDYRDNPLDKHQGKLLIVNLRPNSHSEIGELSNHWRSNEWLETYHYYPLALIEHLNQRSERFELTWSNDKVSVYKIR